MRTLTCITGRVLFDIRQESVVGEALDPLRVDVAGWPLACGVRVEANLGHGRDAACCGQLRGRLLD
jgi:hypothetical protein